MIRKEFAFSVGLALFFAIGVPWYLSNRANRQVEKQANAIRQAFQSHVGLQKADVVVISSYMNRHPSVLVYLPFPMAEAISDGRYELIEGICKTHGQPHQVTIQYQDPDAGIEDLRMRDLLDQLDEIDRALPQDGEGAPRAKPE